MTTRPPRLLGSLPCAAAAACMLTLCAAPALAQSARGSSTSPPTPFQGLQQNNKEPIRIESASLEVRDKERIATFIDNVKVVQGDTTLECNRLIVYYDEEPSPAAAKGRQAAKSMLPSEGGQQQIRRLEAKGGVVVTQKDQIATGDNGVYEMKTNSIVLTGNVIVTRGQDVVKGNRLHVNMTTGHYRMDSAPAGGQSGPVRALINPGARDAPLLGPGAPSAKPAAPAAPAASPLPPPPTGGRTPAAATERSTGATEKDAAKQGPSRPLKLN